MKEKIPWLQRARREMSLALRWLTPGLGIKRYFLLVFLGNTLLAVGLAMFLLNIYRTATNSYLVRLLSYFALQSFDRPLRVLIFGSIGILAVGWGLWGLSRSLLAPYLRSDRSVVETLVVHRQKERGPRVVVIGGGHGLATLLRGLKEHTHNLVSVVTVADDGGSSGRLRQELGILPPGDIRNCLAALSNDEALLTQLFQYRFGAGSGLEGHSFGNLFISALAEVTGSFEEAIAESGRVLSVHGRVLPATLNNVRLVADMVLPNVPNAVRVEGESSIPQTTGRIYRIWLQPSEPSAFPEVVRHILRADLIVIGPGSLYTSILPNLLVPDISAAIRASRALKIFVCNVASQPGETDQFTCDDHIRAIEEHVGDHLFEMMVMNDRWEGNLPAGVTWVKSNGPGSNNYLTYQTDLIDEENPWRHDPHKLAQTLMDLLEERTGPVL